MKLWKLLSVPAAILAAAVFATPALANKATFSDIKISCSAAGHVCVDAKVSTEDFPKGGTRNVIVILKGAKQGEDEFKVLATSEPQSVKDGDTTFHFCFDNVKTTDIEKFKVEIKSADEDLTVKEGESTAQANNCPVMQTTSPSPTETASATASAARTAALASTGGFDFRFPLVAAVLLVVGVSLVLVSVSRGRSATK